MAGLYDSPVGALDPRSMALMQMGLGLMGSSGPSPTPVSLGQSLGQAGMQGIQAYQQSQQANQQQQLFAMKLAAQKKAEADAAARQAAIARLSQDPRFAGMGDLMQVDPSLAIKRAYPEERTKVVAPGSVLVDDQGKEVFRADPKAEQSPIARMIAERDALPAGHPNRAVYDSAIQKATTNQPLVTVDNRQPTKFNEEVGKALGEQYSGLMKADFSAPATIGKYQQLGNLLGQVSTGKFAGTTADIKAAAKGLGMDLTAMGVRDDVAPAQAAKALSNQLALELRNPAGGAGMPGAMSDQDRQFLIQMVPTLENDPGAIGKMIDYRTRLAKREQQVAKMARAYRKKNGTFDEGFFDELQDWSNKNPIFGDEKAPAPPQKVRKFNPATGRIED